MRLSARAARALALACASALPLAAYAGHAYVSNEDEHTVSVLDTDQGTLLGTIEVGKRPRGMKLSHDGALLYVAVSGLPKCPPAMPDAECAKLEHDFSADGIAVVDTRTRKLLRLLRAGSDPEQFDLNSAGTQLYVSNEDTATLSVIDLRGGTIVTRISVGHEPEGVRLAPHGEWVAVTSETDNQVSLIDTHLLQLRTNVPVGHRPRDLAFTPDGRSAYVTGEFDASVYRIAVPAGKPVDKLIQLRKDARPMGVLLDAQRRRLYVSTGRGGTVAVISLQPTRLTTEIKVGARPWGMALTPNKRLLFTANGPSNDVTIVDTDTLRVLKKISVGRSPWGVVIGP